MKRNFIALFAAAAILASCGGKQLAGQQVAEPVVDNTETAQVVYENDYIVKVGDLAPDFTLQLTDGSTFTLSQDRKSVV